MSRPPREPVRLWDRFQTGDGVVIVIKEADEADPAQLVECFQTSGYHAGTRWRIPQGEFASRYPRLKPAEARW